MGGGDEDDHEDVIQAQKKLREFIRNYREGNIYPYREQLQQRWRKRETFLEVNFAHLQEYNHDLMSKIAERPSEYLPLFERAAKDALASDPGLFPSLETLVVGGNPGAGGDAWEAAVEALRTARPGLDVAWRAADAGEAEKAKERGAFAEAK